jgi:hypothetical protein
MIFVVAAHAQIFKSISTVFAFKFINGHSLSPLDQRDKTPFFTTKALFSKGLGVLDKLSIN